MAAALDRRRWQPRLLWIFTPFVCSCGIGLLLSRNVGPSLSFSGLSSISNIGKDSVRLNWTAVNDASSYAIYDVTSDTPVELGLAQAAASSYTATGLSVSTTYRFRVRARDEAGNEDENTNDLSATTLATTDKSGLPASTSLKIWLFASAGITKDVEGRIQRWEDQSGNGNHAVADGTHLPPYWSDLAIGGEPTSVFDSGTRASRIQASYQIGGHTALLVFIPPLTSTSAGLGILGAGQTNSAMFSLSVDFTTGLIRHGGGASFTLPRLEAGVPYILSYRSPGITNGVFRISPRINSVATTDSVSLNSVGSDPATYLGSPLTAIELTGSLAEILVYEKQLTDSEISAAEQYLGQKYGITLGP